MSSYERRLSKFRSTVLTSIGFFTSVCSHMACKYFFQETCIVTCLTVIFLDPVVNPFLVNLEITFLTKHMVADVTRKCHEIVDSSFMSFEPIF